MTKPLQLIPKPVIGQDKSCVADLKNRLDWGEPALTIIDVREWDTFNASHIMGAIAMPLAELITRAQTSLEKNRDIYVYGQTDEQTAEAALQLRQAGYQHIAELVGGLGAWRAAQFPVEGV